MRIWSKFRSLLLKSKLEAEMDEEMRHHIELQTELNVKADMKPNEARFAALRQFGNVASLQEQAREARGWLWLEQMWQDLCYAARALRKTPSFTTTAVLTLALGIGVNAALFTIYNAMALRSLPARAPDELLSVRGLRDRKAQRNDTRFTYAEYLDYRDSNHVFSGLAAHIAGMRLASLETPEAGQAAAPAASDGRPSGSVIIKNVTENYFSVVGADLMLGRSFLPEEMQVSSPTVIVLSHRFWERYWQRDPNVLGKIQRLSGRAYTVVGVTGPEFLGDSPVPPAGWMPVTPGPRADDLVLVGRLKVGVTPAQAKADLDVIAQQRAEAYPREGSKTTVELEPAMRWLSFQLDAMFLVAMSPVLLGFGMVLMLACTNVTNLLLARGVTRQQEIGVRLTLGASRGRIIRQLLTENLLLCAMGAVAGLVLALWALQILRPLVLSFSPAEWAPMTEMWQMLSLGPDGRVIACMVVLTLIAAIAAGLAPALHASRTNLVSTLKDEGSAFGRRLRQSRLRNFLVVAQVAVCLVMLSCAGLLVRHMLRLRSEDLGFETKSVVDVEARWANPSSSDAKQAWIREFMTQARSRPDVAAISATNGWPMPGQMDEMRRVKDPSVSDATSLAIETRHYRASAGFLETFGIAVRGRGFTPQEDSDPQARVIVISETLARRLWSGAEPLGRVLAIAAAPGSEAFVEYRVVGVARDVMDDLKRPRPEVAYLPLATEGGAISGLFLRPRGEAATSFAAIASSVEGSGVKLNFHRWTATQVQERLLPYLGLAALSGALGGLALLMACVGLYGVMSFSVRQRTREIGIHAALGANAGRIVRMFLRQGLRLVAWGVAIGLGGSALFFVLLSKFWFGLALRLDALALGVVTLLLVAVALFVMWLPARRAAKVDPMVALRAE